MSRQVEHKGLDNTHESPLRFCNVQSLVTHRGRILLFIKRLLNQDINVESNDEKLPMILISIPGVTFPLILPSRKRHIVVGKIGSANGYDRFERRDALQSQCLQWRRDCSLIRKPHRLFLALLLTMLNFLTGTTQGLHYNRCLA